jgi:tripartite-type tricarboxylate transporter receptor subunit TctC
LAGLLLAQAQNVKLTHVGYRGGAPALTDVVGGQVDCGILVLSNLLPFIRTGKLRCLGVVENHRAKSAPDIPTLAEGGLTGFSVPDTWVGLLGPKNLPADIMAKLSAAVPQVMKDPGVIAALAEAGYDPVDLNGKQFGAEIAKGAEIYRNIVNKAGIQPE